MKPCASGFLLVVSSFPSICGSYDTTELYIISNESGEKKSYRYKNDEKKLNEYFSTEEFFRRLSKFSHNEPFRYNGKVIIPIFD